MLLAHFPGWGMGRPQGQLGTEGGGGVLGTPT